MATGNRITLVPPEHWLLPTDLPTRYASAIAQASGIRVSIEASAHRRDQSLTVVWRGSEAQYRTTGLVSRGEKFDFKKKIWFCPAWLRGRLHREGPDEFRFDIEFSNELSKTQEGKVSRLAARHEGYQAFRQTLLLWAPEMKV